MKRLTDDPEVNIAQTVLYEKPTLERPLARYVTVTASASTALLENAYLTPRSFKLLEGTMLLLFTYVGDWPTVLELTSCSMWETDQQGTFPNFRAFVQRHADRVMTGINQAATDPQKRAFLANMFEAGYPDWNPRTAVDTVQRICNGWQPKVEITTVGRMNENSYERAVVKLTLLDQGELPVEALPEWAHRRELLEDTVVVARAESDAPIRVNYFNETQG